MLLWGGSNKQNQVTLDKNSSLKALEVGNKAETAVLIQVL